LTTVVKAEHEHFDAVLKRFARKVQAAGILATARNRERGGPITRGMRQRRLRRNRRVRAILVGREARKK
jgi:ribosomal protein S21